MLLEDARGAAARGGAKVEPTLAKEKEKLGLHTHPTILPHYRGCLNPPTCDQKRLGLWDR